MVRSRNHEGLLSAGASLLWRRQSVLWWVFAVNFVLAWLGTMPALHALKGALGHNLAGNALLKDFDLGMFRELTRLPYPDLLRFEETSYLFAGVFALFMLFAGGGILDALRQDRRLSAGEFFGACGSFFWPFVRLALFSAVPFVFLGNLYLELDTLSDKVSDRVMDGRYGFAVLVAGVIVLLLLALMVRLWFDLAKVRAVARNERRMWSNLWQTLNLVRRQLPALVWIYVRIGLLMLAVAVVAFLIWTKLPGAAFVGSFVLIQVVLLLQLAARLWQLAATTAWYQRQPEALAQVQATEAAEPSRQMPLYPETDLPPADA